MVRTLLFILFMLPFFAMADDVKIDASVDQETLFANQPLKGTISITHNKQDQVDLNSFRLGKDPLQVELMQETTVSSSNPLVVSFYRFRMNGQAKGLHLLPSISVKVGDNTYQSYETTYEVGNKTPPVVPSSATTAVGQAILKLEQGIEGPAQVYPGQRIKVFYLYTFNDNIELTNEELPLLAPNGFVKIGELEVEDSNQGKFSTRKISQVLEAQTPGAFSVSGAHSVGYLYRTGPFGNRIYLKPPLEASTQPLQLNVNAFPEKGKPASFNGAIGPFSDFQVALKSPNVVTVGDKITLQLDITGQPSQLEKAKIPDLCCQPGFSGQFNQSDLPPTINTQGPVKSFTVEMRPLNDKIKEIPSLEFSYFTPDTQKYGTLRSKPIPVTVKPLPPTPQPQPQPTTVPPSPEWRKNMQNVEPIEITSIYQLTPSDLYNYRFGTWSVLLLIPLAFSVLILQLYFRNYLRQQEKVVRPKGSDAYFQEALQAGPAAPGFYQLLNKAFIKKLAEKKLIKSEDLDPEDLPTEGLAGEVRAFLLGLQERRYAPGTRAALDSTVVDEAKTLFRRLG